MNVIYLHTHDTGRYIQPYGYAVPTPNLNKLAQDSSLFRHAYSAAPTCSPSRSALLTGMAPHSSGMIGLAHRGFQLRDVSKHLAPFLNRKQIMTVLCGVQHEAQKREQLGYQRILDDDDAGRVPDSVSPDVRNAGLVADFLKAAPDRPFFLSFGMFNTHRPFPQVDPKNDAQYVMPPFPLYDTPANREDFAAYIASAATADHCVGIVLDALAESNVGNDTIVIFTTDHGIAFPKMKCNLYDTGIGVSLIIKHPSSSKHLGVIDALVSQIDLFPTICDFLSLERPDWLHGTSIRPLLEGNATKIRDEIFAEVTYHAAYEPMRCVRTERYKLIRCYDEHDQIVPANIDDGPSKEFLLAHGYLQKRRDQELLFDLYLDPMERVNRREDPRYDAIYRDLTARLESWMVETNDPLLNGTRAPKPAGAIVNRLRCVSPNMDDFE